MKPGFLYVLIHPSNPKLTKVGVTILPVEKRLKQHNTQLDKAAGQVVKETGQLWTLKTFIPVEDVYWAERAFWAATAVADIPFRHGVEVFPMDEWEIDAGLKSAAKAGVRPPPTAMLVDNIDWIIWQLKDTGIKMIETYFGPVREIEFQCAHGHVFKDSPMLLSKKKSCPCCVDWGFTRGSRAGVRESLR